MPLDLSVPPIIIEASKRASKRHKWITRLMETVLILGIVALTTSALVPFL